MYKLNNESPYLKNYDSQLYDEKHLKHLIDSGIGLSNETIRIKNYFNDAHIIPNTHWTFYEWAMLCIGWCFAKTNNPDEWENAPDEKGTKEKIPLETLFQDKTEFWIAYFSETMFNHNPNKKDWERADLLKYIRNACHTGALKLEERYKQLNNAFPEQEWKARSVFLGELMDKAKENIPNKPTDESNENNDKNKPINNIDLSEKLKEIALKYDMPLEKAEFITRGVRYDIYDLHFTRAFELSKNLKNIASELGKNENNLMDGGQIPNISNARKLKILRDEKTWDHYDKNKFQNALKQYQDNFHIPVCIGLDETGTPIFKDYYDAKHSIVGGTTGSGKTVYVCSMLESMFELNSPQKLQIAILDPKGGEDYEQFEKRENLYQNKIISDKNEMVKILKEIKEETDQRKKENNARKITNIPEEKRPPFIIVVLDEMESLLADKKHGKTVKSLIDDIARMGRSLGVLLLLATQQPSRRVLESLPANLTTRIAMQTTSHIDSNMILGTSGAENLIGKGDHLVKWDGGQTTFLHGYNI